MASQFKPRQRRYQRWRQKPIEAAFSVFILGLIAWALWSTGSWLITGADWRVVTHNIPLYAFGSYPADQRWRPLLWMVLILILTITTLGSDRLPPALKRLQPLLPWAWILMVPTGVVLLAGSANLQAVPSRAWGGLTLTLLLTTASGALALPMGVALAIGRTSHLGLVAMLCRLYIDLMRAVPLIAVLFFGQLLLPLFLPVEIEINRVLRAVMAFALFAAAYVAEDVRGGLQSIPPTQGEAAAALGLNTSLTMRLIILPQALRIAVPALTNQAIGLLQNTSLMAILGLIELLGISRSLLANPEYIGRHLEVYVWLAGVYWLLCSGMALLAKRIERQGLLSTSS
jgi:general L-amino acid transport system permease protein